MRSLEQFFSNCERSKHFLNMIVKCWNKALSFYSVELCTKLRLNFSNVLFLRHCTYYKTNYLRNLIRSSVQRLKMLEKYLDDDDKASNQKRKKIVLWRKILEFSAKIINMFMYPFWCFIVLYYLAKSHGSWSKSHVN